MRGMKGVRVCWCVLACYSQPRSAACPNGPTPHLENFIRGPETDPRKETYGLPADAFGGGVTEDGEVKIRCRLRGRIKRDELRFAFYRANEVKVRVKDKQQTMYDILSGTPCREIF